MSKVLPQAIAPHGFTFTMILATLALLASFASSQVALAGDGSAGDPWIITIKYDPAEVCTILEVKAETTNCVGDMDPKNRGLKKKDDDICVARGKWLKWKTDPEKKNFDIYFHPFSGQGFPGNNGDLKKKIDDDAPVALYKYTILMRNCDKKDDVWDPRIRIN